MNNNAEIMLDVSIQQNVDEKTARRRARNTYVDVFQV